MKTSILAIILFASSLLSWSQNPTINFNYELSNLNGGQPMPEETYFVLNGSINQQVTMVEVMIFDNNGKDDRHSLYENIWKRDTQDGRPSFFIPVNYKLRAGNEYDYRINYYRRASKEEITNLRDELFASLDAYLDQHLQFDKKQVNLSKNGKKMAADMNSIVINGLLYYKSPLDIRFPGFSQGVADQLNLITKNNYDQVMGEKSSQSQKLQGVDKALRDLKIRVHSEVAHIFNAGLSVLGDSKYIDDYPVKEGRTILNLHAGFGGVSLEKDLNDENFGSGAMVGITLPLGKSAFRGKFWSNTAFVTGIYLKDFDSAEDGVSASGPIIDKPIYAGLGYRLFQFVRLSAGVTILENRGDLQNTTLNKDIYFRPFVGLTGDIKLWANFGSR